MQYDFKRRGVGCDHDQLCDAPVERLCGLIRSFFNLISRDSRSSTCFTDAHCYTRSKISASNSSSAKGWARSG